MDAAEQARAEPDLSHLLDVRRADPRGRQGSQGKRRGGGVAVQVATLEGADPEVLARGIRYVDGRHDRFDREPENTAAL